MNKKWLVFALLTVCLITFRGHTAFLAEESESKEKTYVCVSRVEVPCPPISKRELNVKFPNLIIDKLGNPVVFWNEEEEVNTSGQYQYSAYCAFLKAQKFSKELLCRSATGYPPESWINESNVQRETDGNITFVFCEYNESARYWNKVRWKSWNGESWVNEKETVLPNYTNMEFKTENLKPFAQCQYYYHAYPLIVLKKGGTNFIAIAGFCKRFLMLQRIFAGHGGEELYVCAEKNLFMEWDGSAWKNLTRITDRGKFSSLQTLAAMDRKANVYVVWLDDRAGKDAVYVSINAGTNKRIRSYKARHEKYLCLIGLYVDKESKVYIFWEELILPWMNRVQESSALYFRRYDGTEWGEITKMLSDYDFASVDVTPDGVIHLIYKQGSNIIYNKVPQDAEPHEVILQRDAEKQIKLVGRVDDQNNIHLITQILDESPIYQKFILKK